MAHIRTFLLNFDACGQGTHAAAPSMVERTGKWRHRLQAGHLFVLEVPSTYRSESVGIQGSAKGKASDRKVDANDQGHLHIFHSFSYD